MHETKLIFEQTSSPHFCLKIVCAKRRGVFSGAYGTHLFSKECMFYKSAYHFVFLRILLLLYSYPETSLLGSDDGVVEDREKVGVGYNL